MHRPHDWFHETAVVLLDTLPAWRPRAVEQIELSSAFWSERNREIHVRPFKEVMREDTKRAPDLRAAFAKLGVHKAVDKQEEIELILPIKELPKIPLLDLTITVDGKEAYRVSKDESARIQACHVVELAKQAGFMAGGRPDYLIDFLTYLFYFPIHPYDSICREYEGRSSEEWEHKYLTRKLANLPNEVYFQWRDIAEEIKQLAGSYALSHPESGAENPLLSVPYSIQEMSKRSPSAKPHWRDITECLVYLARALNQAHEISNENKPARTFISTYFAYGYRWMAFARCTVPVNRPFIITVKEKRAIYFTPERQLTQSPVSISTLGWKGAGRLCWNRARRKMRQKEFWSNLWKKESWHMVAFADAETNHVSIRVSDTSVRLHNPQVLSATKQPLSGDFDEEENTFELYLLQGSQGSQGSIEERFYIKCPLRLTRLHSAMLYLAMIITAFGIILLCNRGLSPVESADAHIPGRSYPQISEGLTSKDSTLILVPVAFAAAFLLIRDSSTLSAWIRRIRQSILLVELFLLLTIAFTLFAAHHVRIG